MQRKAILIETLTELLDEAILCMDEDQTILYTNQGAEAVFGYTPDELLGQPLNRLLPPRTHAIHQQHIQNFLDSPDMSVRMHARRSIVGLGKDGREFPAHATIAKHVTGDGIILTAIVRDVTSEIQLESDLRESLEKLQVLVDQASEGIMVMDQTGDLIEVNARGCEMLGCKPQEMLGHNFRDFIDPEDLEKNPLRIEEVRAGATIVMERQLKRKDGSIQPVEISARMLSDGRLLALVRDFTERKRIETELRKLSRVVEQTPTTVVITDTRGRIEYVNPAFTHISGYTPEEALGKNPRILKSGLVPDETYKDMWSTITAGKVWRGELCNRRKDGTLFWDLGTVSPIRDSSGEITHYIAVKEDITDRKRVEQELERHRDQLEELVTQRTAALQQEIAERRYAQRIARLGNWEWDIKREVLYWADETYRVFGLTPLGEDLSYETFLKAVHPDDREKVESAFNQALAAGQPLSLDHRILLPNGEQRVVHDEAVISFDREGQPSKMVGTVQDITRRKMLEQQVLEKERLEEELRVGREIQSNILPDTVPDIPGWAFATAYKPARQVGGDFYDFIQLDDGCIGMVIADVVGKGVPAALFMALSRAIIRTTALRQVEAVQTLLDSNRVIYEDYHGELFFTAWYALLDPSTGLLKFANGGHNRPIWYRAAQGQIEDLYADGIVLGVLPEINLEPGQLQLEQGDVLLFYTDGLTEAQDKEQKQFGEARLRELLAANAEKTADEIAQALLAAVNAFVQSTPQHDDITLFVVKHVSNGVD